jgi:hypothetical protein
MKDFQNIIGLFEKADQIKPPEDFTRDVLRKMEERGGGVSSSRWNLTEWPFIRGGVSRVDCFLHFAMVGIFYFILSLFLRFGLDNALVNVDFARGIKVQWTLTFLFALIFILLGILLLTGGMRAVKVAQIVTVLYICLVVASGLILNAFIITVPLIPFVTVGFVVTGIAMGLFLVITLKRYERAFG